MLNHKINCYLILTFVPLRICTQSICSDINVQAGSGVQVTTGNFTGGVNPAYIYVAIDSSSIDSNVKLDFSSGVSYMFKQQQQKVEELPWTLQALS